MSSDSARNNKTARCTAQSTGDCPTTVVQQRPAQTLVTREAWGGIVYGCLTLPFTTPAATAVPEWAQLFGLALLAAAPVLRLACWRAMIAAGLSASRRAAAARLDEQCRDERRVRRGALLIVGATVVLLPIPPTWVRFWFVLGMVTTVLALVALVTQQCRSPAHLRFRRPRRRRSPAR
ncbi:hypothetical protein ACFVAV_15515 [Nocardia sp. NPDC057663]|uniref:hypothetical protein n=1 Tax=Nocardia sp. NPDC057663 TaxID=3346201 RepID=UPI00366C1179